MKTSDMTLSELFQLHEHHTDLVGCIAGMLWDWGDDGDPNMPRERLIDHEGVQPIFAELRRLSTELAEIGSELQKRDLAA